MTVIQNKQTKVYAGRTDAKLVRDYGVQCQLIATVKHDDRCNNGHNSFGITGIISTMRGKELASGCLHEDIARLFPELVPFIKWHSTATDGPLYYINNTLYWLGWQGYCAGKIDSPPNLQNARKSAVWADLPAYYVAPSEMRWPGDVSGARTDAGTIQIANIVNALENRKENLMKEFQTAVESLGLIY